MRSEVPPSFLLLPHQSSLPPGLLRHPAHSLLTCSFHFSALDAPVPSRTHLAVVVQTNFQVAAYTRSKLHISTLGLFCDVTTYRRLPNVIFFKITRDSIRSAFRLGVTADQIIRFLLVHAHPMLRSGGHQLVPTNVRDQILLWDREQTRVVMDEVRKKRTHAVIIFLASRFHPFLSLHLSAPFP